MRATVSAPTTKTLPGKSWAFRTNCGVARHVNRRAPLKLPESPQQFVDFQVRLVDVRDAQLECDDPAQPFGSEIREVRVAVMQGVERARKQNFRRRREPELTAWRLEKPLRFATEKSSNRSRVSHVAAGREECRYTRFYRQTAASRRL